MGLELADSCQSASEKVVRKSGHPAYDPIRSANASERLLRSGRPSVNEPRVRLSSRNVAWHVTSLRASSS